jgi:hypothetical protein
MTLREPVWCRTRRSSLLLTFVTLAFAAGAAFAKDTAYHPPRLADGHPDLQGFWDHTDATPLERPAGFSTLVIDADQAAQIERLIANVAEDRAIPTEPTEYFNERHVQPIRGELRSSIIIDPSDGRLPGTPAFKEWQTKARWSVVNALDGPEQRPTSERCLGSPASQPPHLYNPGTNLHQIVQTQDAVLLLSEAMGFARIVRLNAQHAPAAVTSWSGDSIGWWEGDTLVVETRHFTPSDIGRQAPSITFLVSPQATVTERITRVSNDELNYVFTVDDPTHYTRPWTGETHFMRSNDRPLEYACHEANYSLTFILQGGRTRDAQAQEVAAAGSSPK